MDSGALCFNCLNTPFNPICQLQALLGAYHILHIRVNTVIIKKWYMKIKLCKLFLVTSLDSFCDAEGSWFIIRRYCM
jgi:hypothetical protein